MTVTDEPVKLSALRVKIPVHYVVRDSDGCRLQPNVVGRLHVEQEALRRISHEGVDDGQAVGHARKAVGTLRIGGRTAIGPDDGNGDAGHRKALFIAYRTGQFAFLGAEGGVAEDTEERF